MTILFFSFFHLTYLQDLYYQRRILLSINFKSWRLLMIRPVPVLKIAAMENQISKTHSNILIMYQFDFFQPIVIIESQPSSSAQTSVEGSHGNLSCRPKDFLTNVISINNQVRNGVIMIIVKSCQNSKNGTQILIKVIFLPLRCQECHPFPRLVLYHQLIQPLLVLLHSNWPLHLSSWLHRCQPSLTLPRPLLIPQPRNCQVPKMVNRFQFVHHQVKY